MTRTQHPVESQSKESRQARTAYQSRKSDKPGSATPAMAAAQLMATQLMQRKLAEQQLLFANQNGETLQKQANKTGLPNNLKQGMESLSGLALDHVNVHYNSPKPAAIQAHAYAQGNDIHLAPGQEKHLPHELGHVVQQAQGRVKATANVNGLAVNDNDGLESEATRMGERANKVTQREKQPLSNHYADLKSGLKAPTDANVAQRRVKNFKTTKKNATTPVEQVRNAVDPTHFTGDIVTALMNLDLAKNADIDLPTRVEADVNAGDGSITRIAGPATEAGRTGREEMMFRLGQRITTEGGHLIPHACLDQNTAASIRLMVDGPRNIIPMSRTMNMIGWAAIENTLKTSTFAKVDFQPQYDDYEVSNARLAELTGISTVLGHEFDTIAMEATMPTKVNGSVDGIAVSADEPEVYRGRNIVQCGADLVTAMKAVGLWNSLDQGMQTEVLGIP